MYDFIDYDTVSPFQIMQILKAKKDKERIDKVLNLKIFEVKNKELIIPSFKCVSKKKIGHDTQNFKNWFPFPHQVFWFCLMDMKDLDFAISEVKRIVEGEKQYMFPNGTYVELLNN